MFIANGTYSVMRGRTVVNQYGDEQDSRHTIRRGLIGSVVERSRQVFDPNSQRLTSVRYATGRFDGDTDLKTGDRIYNERTKAGFIIDNVVYGANTLYRSDVVVELIRTEDDA